MDYEGAIAYMVDRLDRELAPHLFYHGGSHTIDVLGSVVRIAEHENINGSDLNLLKVAAAYHDSGFLIDHREHEVRGCELAKEILPDFGFDRNSIESVCVMIMATKIPQTPTDLLSEILCDADLDYLGRDDFEPIATNLFRELNHLGIVNDIRSWNRIQLGFLEQHNYHTSYGKTLRQPKKRQHLEKIRAIVSGYDE